MAAVSLPNIANLVLLLVSMFCDQTEGFFGGGDKVLLRDINVLTLYNGRMTTGQRSSPVKQLQCTGGSAGCSAFTPQVVQCYNRGSDGYDVQWECKTDMDNAYRFGRIEVSCEGYSHPDDDYILKGSCGLEYTIDLTKEGMQNKNQHSYYGDSGGSYGNSHNYYGSYNKHSSGIGDWIMLAIVGVIIYGIYRTCVATSPTDSDYPDDQSGDRWGQGRMGGGGGGGGGYTGNTGYPGSGSCSGTRGSTGSGMGATGAAGAGGGGFWTGAAAGGLLGYLFGNRGTGYGYGGYGRPRYGYRSGYNSGWGGSGFGGGRGFGGSSFGGGGGGFSTGTRSASGFGGTRRR